MKWMSREKIFIINHSGLGKTEDCPVAIPEHTIALFSKMLHNLKPPQDMNLSEWADEYRIVSEGNAEPGRWHTDRAPYQREIMDAITNPRVSRVVVMSGAQLGKTDAFVLNAIAYFMHQDPCRMIVMMPSLELAEALSKERLSPMIRDTKVLSRLVKDKKRDSGNTIRLKLFPGGYVALIGANSPASLSSRPARAILLDEVDRYPESAGKDGDPVALAEARNSNFWNRKTILTSTPTTEEESRISPEFENSTQEEWNVPCPDCGHLQPLEWGQIIFDKDDLENISHSCIVCGAVSGEVAWKKAQEKGIYIAKYPDRKTRGFHLNSLASPWKTWREIVEDFLKANDAKKNGNIELMKTWVNNVLGQTWEEDGESVDAEDFLARRETYGCDVPDRVMILTAGVDVQADRLEVEVVGWGENKESWGIQYARLHGDPEQDDVWNRLDEYLSQPFYKKDGTVLIIDGTAVDTGYKSLKVYRYCKPRELRHIYAIKGQGGVYPFIGKASTANRAGATLFPIGANSGKDAVMERLKVDPPVEADAPCGGYCHFPDDAGKGYDEYYFNTLTAEKKVLRYVKGRQRFEWVPKRKGARNEGLDLRVYATAALEIRNPSLKSGNTAPVKKKRRRGVVSKGL